MSLTHIWGKPIPVVDPASAKALGRREPDMLKEEQEDR